MGRLVVIMLAALVSCDYHPYSYDTGGRILGPSGQPLAGIRVSACAPAYVGRTTPPPAALGVPSTAPAGRDDEILMRDSAITDTFGRFRLTFTGDLDKHQWFIIHQAPELPTVYVWLRAGPYWRAIPVNVSLAKQADTFFEGRVLHLPDIVCPSLGGPDPGSSVRPPSWSPTTTAAGGT